MIGVVVFAVRGEGGLGVGEGVGCCHDADMKGRVIAPRFDRFGGRGDAPF